jgi:hypothetical protein
MIPVDVRRAAAVISGAILAGAVLASSAGAANVIAMRPGDYVYLAGTSVRCGFVKANGLTFLSCGVVDKSGDAIRGSYVAAIMSNGRVAIVHAIKPGNTPTVFDRTPAAVVARMAAKPGDHIEPTGTLITCSVALVTSEPTIFCDLLDGKGTGYRPGSYAFGMGDTVLTSLGWDAKGKVHLLKTWPENG